MAALRCHLLIGPPASGKTTIAALLSPLLDAELLSTDRIREELYGDPMIQGHWSEVEERLHEAIQSCVASGHSVLIDATHARRPWRLALNQRLELDRPVEWIGWWLRTPREVCLTWNQQRERLVPELVIHQFAAALDDAVFAPDRSEGFAALVDFDPSLGGDLRERLIEEQGRLERRIAAARNKERAKELHRYSRLLDLFGQYGEVCQCSLPLDRETVRKRGFAFVELADDAAEQKAIDDLQDVESMGRMIRVNKATRKGGGGGNRW